MSLSVYYGDEPMTFSGYTQIQCVGGSKPLTIIVPNVLSKILWTFEVSWPNPWSVHVVHSKRHVYLFSRYVVTCWQKIARGMYRTLSVIFQVNI